MTKLKKVIKGLECCRAQLSSPLCEECPYKDDVQGTCDTLNNIFSDALELLEAQEPRVLTANEIIKTTEVTTCYVEVKGERNLYGAYLQKYDDDHTLIATDVQNVPEMMATGHARLWSSRPTDEQREATPWEN